MILVHLMHGQTKVQSPRTCILPREYHVRTGALPEPLQLGAIIGHTLGHLHQCLIYASSATSIVASSGFFFSTPASINPVLITAP